MLWKRAAKGPLTQKGGGNAESHTYTHLHTHRFDCCELHYEDLLLSMVSFNSAKVTKWAFSRVNQEYKVQNLGKTRLMIVSVVKSNIMDYGKSAGKDMKNKLCLAYRDKHLKAIILKPLQISFWMQEWCWLPLPFIYLSEQPAFYNNLNSW